MKIEKWWANKRWLLEKQPTKAFASYTTDYYIQVVKLSDLNELLKTMNKENYDVYGGVFIQRCMDKERVLAEIEFNLNGNNNIQKECFKRYKKLRDEAV